MSFLLRLRPLLNHDHARVCHNGSSVVARYYSIAPPKAQTEPLRILFCGSDAFSIESLQALHGHARSSGSRIESIDVVTKKDKPSGRGLRQLKSPPIKSTALRLGLPVHQIDTFTSWKPPTYSSNTLPDINLIVAVSFGLLVPPRLIHGSRYGGLNVHPSLLPDLRGAAPIQWTILNGYKRTGISIQTLHPSKFDGGVVLKQLPIAVPGEGNCTFTGLRDHLGPIGGQLLVQTIEQKLYVPPYENAVIQNQPGKGSLAPKVTPAMQMLNFDQQNSDYILRMGWAMDRLWSVACPTQFEKEKGANAGIRITFGAGIAICGNMAAPALQDFVQGLPHGLPFVVLHRSESIFMSDAPLLIKAKDNCILSFPTMTVAGQTPGPAAVSSAKATLFDHPILVNDHQIYLFSNLLSGNG